MIPWHRQGSAAAWKECGEQAIGWAVLASVDRPRARLDGGGALASTDGLLLALWPFGSDRHADWITKRGDAGLSKTRSIAC